ncbi:hypothetical protein TNCV_1418981 [Trichonephila clavipes]|nr:hypothetical protein TNCV_1418981 [Trichonephila clavipes]
MRSVSASRAGYCAVAFKLCSKEPCGSSKHTQGFHESPLKKIEKKPL